MARSIYGAARSAVRTADRFLGYALDVADVPEGSEADRKIQAALDSLYEALTILPREAKHASRLKESSLLVFPHPKRDMRFWRMSDGRRASSLLRGKRAQRVASAVKVAPALESVGLRPMTIRSYLKAFDNAIVTDGNTRSVGYRRSRVLM
jgi:hypothetical protein